MNRGSTSAGRPAATYAPGFNEAPIHESGKWRQLSARTMVGSPLQ